MVEDTDHIGSNHPALTVRSREHDGVIVVSVAGELDMATVPNVSRALDEAVARGKPLVVDLTGLTFFSSAGLTLLVRLKEQLPEPDSAVRLVGNQRVVILPLELAGLRDLFPMYASLDEALVAR